MSIWLPLDEEPLELELLDVDPPDVELPEVELLELLELVLFEGKAPDDVPLEVEAPELELPEVDLLEVVPPGMSPPGVVGSGLLAALSGLVVTVPSPSVPPPPPQASTNRDDDNEIRASRLVINLLMAASRIGCLRHRVMS